MALYKNVPSSVGQMRSSLGVVSCSSGREPTFAGNAERPTACLRPSDPSKSGQYFVHNHARNKDAPPLYGYFYVYSSAHVFHDVVPGLQNLDELTMSTVHTPDTLEVTARFITLRLHDAAQREQRFEWPLPRTDYITKTIADLVSVYKLHTVPHACSRR